MTTQWESLANEHILGIAPYEPGKPAKELERELGIHDAIKLASNENPLSPSDRVQQAIIAALAHLNRYPDGSGYYLRQALASKHRVTPDHVMLGNGSNELIELVVRTFLRPGDEAVVPHPSFVVYPMIVQAAGGIRVMVMLKDHRLDLEAMARAITPMTKIVFIANPNNPTATIVTGRRGRALHVARARAHASWCSTRPTWSSRRARISPTRSATSSRAARWWCCARSRRRHSLAGLRVGYGVADADAIALMNRIRQPFNVNSLAQAAALAALDDESHTLECVRMIEAGRHYLYDEFNALGVKYVPSRANFILVDVGRSASDIYQRLLKDGVIVRPMTPFGMESRCASRSARRRRTAASSRRCVRCWGRTPRDRAPGDRRRRTAGRLTGEGRPCPGDGQGDRRDRTRCESHGARAARRRDRPGDDGHRRRCRGRGPDRAGRAGPGQRGPPAARLAGARAGAVVTDVGSTKRGIVTAAERLAALRPEVRFVGVIRWPAPRRPATASRAWTSSRARRSW